MTPVSMPLAWLAAPVRRPLPWSDAFPKPLPLPCSCTTRNSGNAASPKTGKPLRPSPRYDSTPSYKQPRAPGSREINSMAWRTFSEPLASGLYFTPRSPPSHSCSTPRLWQGLARLPGLKPLHWHIWLGLSGATASATCYWHSASYSVQAFLPSTR